MVKNQKDYIKAWRNSPDRPKAKCHPDEPHRARGMCATCYDRWLYANSPKNRTTKLRNAAKWKVANESTIKARQRAHRLRKRYGIDEAEFQSMVARQKSRCALCDKRTKLHIDHCHDTGVVRGLLCLRCNGSLSWVEQLLRQKHTLWFKRALEYLDNAKKNPKAKN